MPSLFRKLEQKQLLKTPQSFVANTIHYEVETGSVAYGVANRDSDVDVVGFCIPPKNIVFPHFNGEILGFGKNKQRFEQEQQHHIIDPTARGGEGQEYDLNIYNIVKFFNLCMAGNVNMVDTLFVPNRCVLFMTPIGSEVRMSRKMFLSKHMYHKFRGYAYAQCSKMKNKKSTSTKRRESIDKFGYDVKHGMHVVRLMLQAEQVLMEGDLDLELNKEVLKSIRKGEWKEQDIYDFFDRKERELDKLYQNSKLQYGTDEEKIKDLLLRCLEMNFQGLEGCVETPDKYKVAIDEIKEIVRKL